MVRDLLIFGKEIYKMRAIISYKDSNEVSKFIIEFKYFKIKENEAAIITSNEENFEGPIFKIDIPKGLSEKIEKWMFINGKYDFSGFKTYVISKRKDKWICVYDPEEEENGRNNN